MSKNVEILGLILACFRSTLVVVFQSRRHAVDREQLLRCVSDDGQHVADEAIDVSSTWRLVDYILVVVISQASTQLLIVHLGFVLTRAPASSHLVRVTETELPVVARPRDVVLTRRVEQQFQQKLPQLDWTAACTHTNKRLLHNLSLTPSIFNS